MSHLEVLMSKGILNGPPYVLPEDVELTFLRKFIERQAAGIPHNPRLRNRTIKADLIVDPRTGASTPSDTMAGGSSYGDRNALPNTLHGEGNLAASAFPLSDDERRPCTSLLHVTGAYAEPRPAR